MRAQKKEGFTENLSRSATVGPTIQYTVCFSKHRILLRLNMVASKYIRSLANKHVIEAMQAPFQSQKILLPAQEMVSPLALVNAVEGQRFSVSLKKILVAFS